MLGTFCGRCDDLVVSGVLLPGVPWMLCSRADLDVVNYAVLHMRWGRAVTLVECGGSEAGVLETLWGLL